MHPLPGGVLSQADRANIGELADAHYVQTCLESSSCSRTDEVKPGGDILFYVLCYSILVGFVTTLLCVRRRFNSGTLLGFHRGFRQRGQIRRSQQTAPLPPVHARWNFCDLFLRPPTRLFGAPLFVNASMTVERGRDVGVQLECCFRSLTAVDRERVIR